MSLTSPSKRFDVLEADIPYIEAWLLEREDSAEKKAEFYYYIGGIMMIEALLLGLSTGPSCMLFCGPVAVPLFMSHMKEGKAMSLDLLRFMTGRLIGYLTAGLILGFSGTLLMSFLPLRTQNRFILVSTILAGILMLLRALRCPGDYVGRIGKRLEEGTLMVTGAGSTGEYFYPLRLYRGNDYLLRFRHGYPENGSQSFYRSRAMIKRILLWFGALST